MSIIIIPLKFYPFFIYFKITLLSISYKNTKKKGIFIIFSSQILQNKGFINKISS